VIIEWFCLERSFAILVDGSGIKVKANDFLVHYRRNFSVAKGGFTVSKQGMALVCVKYQMTVLGLQLICNVGYL
jgi:hypothetical protein